MASAKCDKVFCGTFVHSSNENLMQILMNKAIGVDSSGKIIFFDDESRIVDLQEKFSFTTDQVTYLSGREYIIPGFVDTHIHAPQYIFTGTGYDLPLLGWLEKYTFPSEAKFKDVDFAKMAYRKAVERTLKNGTTTASYFATIHYDACTVLCDLVEELGQRAYIGKVCMDRNAPEFYVESTRRSVEDTERFIKYVLAKNDSLITPVITPRFVITCSEELMKGLGQLAQKYQLPIQSHLSENLREIREVNAMHPDSLNYTNLYKEMGLLTEKTYMAHCCHVSLDEVKMLSECKTSVAHCPMSNFDIRSGVADVKLLTDHGIDVGLGTDIAGGHSPSMLSAIHMAIVASNTIQFTRGDDYKPISYKEAFYMATLGGSKVLGLDNVIGNFIVGKQFDALLIDTGAKDSPFDVFEDDSIEDLVQKFLYIGDDRNIKKVFVAGKLVSGTAK
ncbi:guanine deaminase-like [Actinia tenebrosa]|uniref:Guanine deaminase n=1 Tax=Actinia tenebrosa TaxID=6105 RepID=A0A6P8IKI4_ACTTE|nr:guanine deaminase-like [Actinia tenebrosa]